MQMYLFSVSAFIAFWLVVGYVVSRAWRRWARSKVDDSTTQWRNSIAVAGFAASNVSLLLIMLVMGTGYFSHAYVPDTYLGLLALRLVLFTALGGILAALVGVGPLRIPCALCSSGSFLALVIHWLGR